MSRLMETSLMSMKLAFPSAPDPIQGIPMLASLINLDDTYLPVFVDPQDTCLDHYEHVVLCCITRSLFILHK